MKTIIVRSRQTGEVKTMPVMTADEVTKTPSGILPDGVVMPTSDGAESFVDINGCFFDAPTPDNVISLSQKIGKRALGNDLEPDVWHQNFTRMIMEYFMASLVATDGDHELSAGRTLVFFDKAVDGFGATLFARAHDRKKIKAMMADCPLYKSGETMASKAQFHRYLAGKFNKK